MVRLAQVFARVPLLPPGDPCAADGANRRPSSTGRRPTWLTCGVGPLLHAPSSCRRATRSHRSSRPCATFRQRGGRTLRLVHDGAQRASLRSNDPGTLPASALRRRRLTRLAPLAAAFLGLAVLGIMPGAASAASAQRVVVIVGPGGVPDLAIHRRRQGTRRPGPVLRGQRDRDLQPECHVDQGQRRRSRVPTS